MKIVSSGGTLASPGFLEKKQKARRKRLTIISGILLALFISSVFVLRMKSFRISSVTVTGAQAIDAAKVEAGVREALAGSFFFVIPHDSAFLYRNGKIRREIESRFPRFRSIELSLSGFDSLGVSVEEREPHALYCGKSASTAGSPCYFLDETGFIFDNAPGFSDGVYFAYASEEAVDEPLGSYYLPVSEFEPLAGFIAKLPALGLDPLSLQLADGEFTLSLANGGKILWPRESDIARIYSNLEAFLVSPEIAGDKTFISRFSQLDLRTEDKVFYKFREAEVIE
jgi:hypothetical protein